MPLAPLYILSAMLLLGAAPLPYGYYTLLRVVACGLFVWGAYIGQTRRYRVLPWFYVLLALMFNPVIPIHLKKNIWAVADLAAAIFLLATARHLRERRPDDSESPLSPDGDFQ
jgi:hypothetical protein